MTDLRCGGPRSWTDLFERCRCAQNPSTVKLWIPGSRDSQRRHATARSRSPPNIVGHYRRRQGVAYGQTSTASSLVDPAIERTARRRHALPQSGLAAADHLDCLGFRCFISEPASPPAPRAGAGPAIAICWRSDRSQLDAVEVRAHAADDSFGIWSMGVNDDLEIARIVNLE